MRTFFAAGARALVRAQRALDAHAAARREATDASLPPRPFAFTRCRLVFPVELRCRARLGLGEPSMLSLSPAEQTAGRVSVTLRFLSCAELPTQEHDGTR